MSKKTDSMTPEERAKKFGNEIMGVGIIYLVLYIIVSVLAFSALITSPISAVLFILQIALLIFMIIGGKQRNRMGVKAALVFEIYMIVSCILSLILLHKGPDLIGLLVMIFLPVDIKGLSQAIKEIEYQGMSQEPYSENK